MVAPQGCSGLAVCGGNPQRGLRDLARPGGGAGAVHRQVRDHPARVPGEVRHLVQQARQLLEARGVGSGEVEKALNIDANRVFSIVTAILDSTLGVFSGVLFIVALLLFMATDAITYERRLEILQRMRPDIASALTTFSVGIKKYLLVSTVFGLIVAALDAGALWLIGIPLPILWGLLSFITNYIPMDVALMGCRNEESAL